jgi:hypothetical protein
MKIQIRKRRRSSAFTLTELMIGVSVLVVVLSGVITGHLTGLKMFQITKAKLGASDEAREAVSKLVNEVRGARWLQVGNGNASSFTPIEDGNAQQGTAVEIYSTDTTNDFTRYYLDTQTRTLSRITSGNSARQEIAHSITNQIVFAAENAQGTVLTNSENNRVLSLTLQFYQIQYPIVQVGPGKYYDFYQLRTRITRRTLE